MQNTEFKNNNCHSIFDTKSPKRVPKLRFKGFNGEWKKYELSEILKNTSKKYNPKINSNNFKCIELEHLSQNHGRLLGYVDSNKQQSIKNVFKSKQVLFGKLRPYLKKSIYTDFDGVCSTEIWVLDGIKVRNDYLYNLIQTHRFMESTKVSTGSKMPRADWNYMSTLPFSIPTLPEQQKIADCLSTWDEAITTQTSLIENKKLFKKGMMQKIFSQEIRFKADDGSEYPAWVEKKLGEVCDVAKSGGTPTSTNKSYYTGNIPFLAISDMTSQGKYLTSTSKTVSQKGVDNSASWIIPVNTIIYSMYASVGFVSINKIPIATSQAVINLILKNNISNEYIYYFLLDYKKYIHKYVETGTQGNLNSQSVKSLKIKLPILQEQTKIANFLSCLDDEIDLLEQELAELELQKK